MFGRVKEVYSLSTERERRLAFASRQGFHEITVTFRLQLGDRNLARTADFLVRFHVSDIADLQFL